MLPQDGTTYRPRRTVLPDNRTRVAALRRQPEHLRVAVLLGVFAGLRVSEAVALRTEDVDFIRGVVQPKVQWAQWQLHFHCLRHHLATLLIDSGCDVKTVQARMRHRSAKTTLDVYGHRGKDKDETTRAAIGGVIAARVASSSEDPAGALRAKRS
jgi:integrase